MIEKMNQINPKIRNSINIRLKPLTGIRNDLPFDSIDGIFHSFGLRLVQEDGTDFEAIFTGAEGRVKIPVAEVNINNIVNNYLIAAWYQYKTGRFDFNCYLS